MTYSNSSLPFWFLLTVILAYGFGAWYTWTQYGISWKVRAVGAAAGLLLLIPLPQEFFESFFYTLRIEEEQIQWTRGDWWWHETGGIRLADAVCVKIEYVGGKGTKNRWYVKYKKETGPYLSLGGSRLLDEHKNKIEKALRDKKIPLNPPYCDGE